MNESVQQVDAKGIKKTMEDPRHKANYNKSFNSK
jgi:hypothetical protein